MCLPRTRPRRPTLPPRRARSTSSPQRRTSPESHPPSPYVHSAHLAPASGAPADPASLLQGTVSSLAHSLDESTKTTEHPGVVTSLCVRSLLAARPALAVTDLALRSPASAPTPSPPSRPTCRRPSRRTSRPERRLRLSSRSGLLSTTLPRPERARPRSRRPSPRSPAREPPESRPTSPSPSPSRWWDLVSF